jgi:hypothetical protein
MKDMTTHMITLDTTTVNLEFHLKQRSDQTDFLN